MLFRFSNTPKDEEHREQARSYATPTRGLEQAPRIVKTHNRYNARMHITLNGQPRDCASSITVARLLDEAGYAGRRVAVEVNREIVPRSRHAEHRLADGDQVEIVHAIGGG
jgi:sulfur carrier protein